MSKFQSKISYTKNYQEDLKSNEKRQLTEDNTQMTQMLELHNKDYKSSITKMFQRAIMKMRKKIESLSKDLRRHKKEQNTYFRTTKIYKNQN